MSMKQKKIKLGATKCSLVNALKFTLSPTNRVCPLIN